MIKYEFRTNQFRWLKKKRDHTAVLQQKWQIETHKSQSDEGDGWPASIEEEWRDVPVVEE